MKVDPTAPAAQAMAADRSGRRARVPTGSARRAAATWCGDGRTFQGGLVNAGLYHFRVQAIDSAGNAAGWTESASFLLIRIGSLLRVSIHVL